MMKKRFIRVSVIIPLYNEADRIARCLDSLVEQKFEDFEVLVIDDGSSDGSEKICDEYASRDKRIKVIHKENEGVAEARNVGVKEAKGEYVTFVDADDYVDKKYLQRLLDLAEKRNVEIVQCGTKVVAEGKERLVGGKVETQRIYKNTDALKVMLYQREITSSVWGKLYKADIVRQIKLPKGIIHEDLWFNYLALKEAKEVLVTDEILYYYVWRKNSLIHAKKFDKKMDILGVVEKIKKDTHDKATRKAILSRQINADLFVLRQLPRKEYPKVYEELWKDVKENRAKVLADSEVRVKTKVGLIISYLGMPALKGFYWATSFFMKGVL